MQYRYITTSIICLLVFLTSNSYALRTGDMAPDILGRSTTGQLFKLSKYSGKIRLINFFSMYCKPCKKELPELGLLEKEFPDIMVIAIHLGSQPAAKVERFLSRLSGHPEKIVCSSLAVKESYGFRGFPHSVVIDNNNLVYKIIPGYNTYFIKSALKELSRK